MAAYSFLGIPFDREGSGIWEENLPEPETVLDVAKMPLTNTVIVDDGGDGLATWAEPIIVLAANVAAMRAARTNRTRGALVAPSRTYSSAWLTQIRRVSRLRDGTYYRLEVEIILA